MVKTVRIALIGENSIEYIITLIDIWNNGDCAVLLDWRISFQTALEMMFSQRYVFSRISEFAITVLCLNPTLLSMYADDYKRGTYDINSKNYICERFDTSR